MGDVVDIVVQHVQISDCTLQLAACEEKDSEGGPFPAYPSGKTWDEPSGKTGSGKKFFHNIIDGSKAGVFQNVF